MKPREYTEGPEAIQNFKALAIAILQVNPGKKRKNAKQEKPTSRKAKNSDKD